MLSLGIKMPLLRRLWAAKKILLFIFILNGCSQKTAPQITFKSIAGEIIQPSNYQNDVIVVNFWSTTCVSCIQKMPKLIDTYQRFKHDNFKLFAVAMSYDRPDYVLHFTQKHQLPFYVVLDLNGTIAQQYNQVKVTPTTFLVAPNGRIIQEHIGDIDMNALTREIEKLIQSSSEKKHSTHTKNTTHSN